VKNIYCQQCQESKIPACTPGGVCGKTTAAYQDAALYALSGLAYRLEAAEKSFDIFAGVLDVLVKTFGLQPSTTVETDLKTLKCV